MANIKYFMVKSPTEEFTLRLSIKLLDDDDVDDDTQ